MPSSTDTFRIDLARRDDLVALLALEHDCFQGDRLGRRQYLHLLRSPSALVFSAHDGERLVGAAVLLFRRGTRVARLYSLAVDATIRGHGVGRMLLAATERRAQAHGCVLLRLEVRADNRAAQVLYEQAGFRRHGQRQAYYDDGADAWLYEKRLVVAAKT